MASRLPAWNTLRDAATELWQADLPRSQRAARLGARVVHAGRLDPHVRVCRRVVVELSTPPKPLRGFRDLVVRLGGEGDLGALCEIDATPAELVRARFRRGDLAYVGVSGGRVLCKTWFHRGPAAFDEHEEVGISWALDDTSFWSYNGAAAPEALATGAFMKMFGDALRDLFVSHGGTRVLGWIRDDNSPSLTLHDRLGWARLGALISVLLPGLKWLRWDGQGFSRQWLRARSTRLDLPMPPR